MSKLDLSWLKIDTHIGDDPKIDGLMDRRGLAGLGAFLMVLATVAREGDDGGTLRASWNGGKTELQWLSKQSRVPLVDLKPLLDDLSYFHLIDPTLWSQGIVGIPKILDWHSQVLILRDNGKYGKLGGRPPKNPTNNPKGKNIETLTETRVEKSRVEKSRVERGEGSARGEASLTQLRVIFNDAIREALGPATEYSYQGDPSALGKKTVAHLERLLRSYPSDRIKSAVMKAPDDPYHNGKKDGNIRLGFQEVMWGLEALMAKSGGRLPEQPYRPLG